MKNVQEKITRRSVLRGTLGGVGVSVALPILECFLNDSGTALASGAPIPVRFGTWFWGLGMDKQIFVPKKLGPDYELPPQIASWKDVRQHVNLFTNYNVLSDGQPIFCHISGWVALRSGAMPATRESLPAPSIDVLVSDAIGGGTRFKALDCTATGIVGDTFSYRSAQARNIPATTPADLYTKIFGSDFQDPNSPDFKPNPALLTRRSVLSAVRGQSASVQALLGAADRARLDQYFTSIREMERRLELQLQKPPPAPSCKIPPPVTVQIAPGLDTELAAQRHNLMADLLAMALACNQTRVFNMTYSNGLTGLARRGLDKTHHTVTHEESFDSKLGYQPTNHWFLLRAMEAWAYFVKALASIPEGDGTLLDNCLVYAHSDHEYAKTHTVTGIPMMTAGRAGGRIKTGLHIDGKGEASTQLGLTLMHIMGLTVGEWGRGSLKTSREISEILV